MAAGVNISKTNLTVGSRPTPGVLLSKTNLTVGSRPTPGVLLSKTNLMVASLLGGGRRRISLMF
jgi:hypothetical protein